MKMHYLILLSFLAGCDKWEFKLSSDFPPEEIVLDAIPSVSYGEDYSPGVVMSNDVLERAYQMAAMEWAPINPIPKINGGYYPIGQTVTGAPYSSVKEINSYLFQDVSYHTFMTAVHNPKSVLYTENLSKAPYHGKNCAPYYGAVCSSAVMYALGFDVPYYVRQIKELPSMKKLEHQEIDSLRICDVILNAGHGQMIYGIEHRADTIYRITTFESGWTNARLTKYSRKQFLKMWGNGKYVGYRYKNLKYSEEIGEFKSFDSIVYNDDLCPSKGDKAVYRTTDTVKIHIFNPSFDRIVISKDMSDEGVVSAVSGEEYCYYDLQPGIYSVSLLKNEGKSADVSFEIIETDVSCSTYKNEYIVVNFNSSADPVYAALCDLSGDSSFYYHISDTDKGRGYFILPRQNSGSDLFCKVVFKGEFGRIINTPIRVE